MFISYSRSDKRAADVVKALQQHGYEVWLDTEAIRGADDWRTSISRGIREADAFIVLISPGAATSKQVRAELGLAHETGKRIIPVRTRRMAGLPEGLDLILEGVQLVDLFPDLTKGLDDLVEAVGGSAPIAPGQGIRQRVKQRTIRVRRYSREHELARKVTVYGGAVLTGAALAAASMRKAAAEQEAERVRQGLDDYLERAENLLIRGINEIAAMHEMSISDYREEFRPRFMEILGGLDALSPRTPEIKEHHDRLVANLRRLLREFDTAASKTERGDETGYAMRRLNQAWSETLSTSLAWLTSTGQLATDRDAAEGRSSAA